MSFSLIPNLKYMFFFFYKNQIKKKFTLKGIFLTANYKEILYYPFVNYTVNKETHNLITDKYSNIFFYKPRIEIVSHLPVYTDLVAKRRTNQAEISHTYSSIS